MPHDESAAVLTENARLPIGVIRSVEAWMTPTDGP
jgi:hypothetical protein